MADNLPALPEGQRWLRLAVPVTDTPGRRPTAVEREQIKQAALDALDAILKPSSRWRRNG